MGTRQLIRIVNATFFQEEIGFVKQCLKDNVLLYIAKGMGIHYFHKCVYLGTQMRTLVYHFFNFPLLLKGEHPIEIGVSLKATNIDLDSLFLLVVISVLVHKVTEVCVLLI